MDVVDTHAHIYSEDEARYPKTARPLRPPTNTGTSEHLRRETRTNGVARVVLIQTLTAYRYDNRLTFDTANTNKDWTTGVCTLDPENPESPALLERLVMTGNIRGIRLYPTSGDHPTLNHEGHRRLWETATRLGVNICVLVDRSYADELSAHLERFPQTPVVLDHCMNLRAGDEATLGVVCDMARHPNLYAKLTFAVTGSDESYPCADTHDLIRQIIEAYGPERCVWGSDFPCELWCPKVTYGDHLRIFTQELGLSASLLGTILGETARKLWFPESA